MTARRTTARQAQSAAPAQYRREVSAGGVAFRRRRGRVEIAVISVGDPPRWQLPKGLIDRGESPLQAALREVREEAGLETELVEPLDEIHYWYQRTDGAARVRVRKSVHFFLLRRTSGDVAGHDAEVNEARWVDIETAPAMLAFPSEKRVVAAAAARLGTAK